MNDDFAELPASRRMLKAEDIGKTAAERAEAERLRLWGDDREATPKPPLWQAGAPSDPRVLRLLSHPHAPNGMPVPPGRFKEPAPPSPDASDKELAAAVGLRHRLYEQWREDDDSYLQRFECWAGLDAATKSQLAADTQYGEEDAPQWLCSVAADPIHPPIVLRAAGAQEARDRYKALMGIRFVEPSRQNDFADPIQATPYVPAAG